MRKNKKRVAFLGVGVLEIPSYINLLEELSKEYQIDLFAEYRYKRHQNNHFKIIKVFAFKNPRRLREFTFFLMVFFRMLFFRYSIIHCHSTFPTGFTGILLGKLFRKKVIVSLDAAELSVVPDINFGGLLNPKSAEMSKWVIRRADHVTALTEFQAKDIRANTNNEINIEVIPRGINLTKFNYQPKSQQEEIKLLSICYLHPIKNPLMLLDVLEILNKKIKCKLIHVGADFFGGNFKKIADKRKLLNQITFMGTIPNEEMNSIYHSADLFIHTSRYESQGIVFSEAMASGLPVISTRVGLCADLGEQYCVCVEQFEAQEMANAILKLIEQAELKHKMIQNARSWVEENDLKKTCSIYAQHYQNLGK